jgi:hypothetical protein
MASIGTTWLAWHEQHNMVGMAWTAWHGWHNYQNSGKQKLGIASGTSSITWDAAVITEAPAGKWLGIATGGITWDAAVFTKPLAGKWLSIAAGGITSKLRQAKDSASLEMLLWLLKLRQANNSALPLVALLQNSGRQKTWHCHWLHPLRCCCDY